MDSPMTSVAEVEFDWRIAALNFLLRWAIKPRLQSMPVTLDAIYAMRHQVNSLVKRFSYEDELVERFTDEIASVPVEILQPLQEGPLPTKQILYIHGGAFISCSPTTHRGITQPLVRGTAARVVAVDYRLCPEHRFPSAVEDVLNVYAAMVATTSASNIAVAGDSAGGNLALALLHAAQERGLPMPASAVCLSPWTDLTGSGDSVRQNISRDALLPGERMTDLAHLYLDGHYIKAPTASPLFGQFADFPPLLFHVGDTEILLDDTVRCVAKARAAGVETQLRIWPKLPHVFHVFSQHLPVARTALNEINDFILSKWAAQQQ